MAAYYELMMDLKLCKKLLDFVMRKRIFERFHENCIGSL